MKECYCETTFTSFFHNLCQNNVQNLTKLESHNFFVLHERSPKNTMSLSEHHISKPIIMFGRSLYHINKKIPVVRSKHL